MEQFTQKVKSSHLPSTRRWKVRWSLAALETFLELHSKTALQHSPKQPKELDTCCFVKWGGKKNRQEKATVYFDSMLVDKQKCSDTFHLRPVCVHRLIVSLEWSWTWQTWRSALRWDHLNYPVFFSLGFHGHFVRFEGSGGLLLSVVRLCPHVCVSLNAKCFPWLLSVPWHLNGI